MARIVLHKGSDTKIVSLGPSLHFCVFDFLYLFHIKLRKEAFIMLFIHAILFFIYSYTIAHNILLTLILFPLIFLIETLSLLLPLSLLRDIIEFLIFFNPSNEVFTISFFILLIIEISIFIIGILYSNKWYCKKLLEEGYSPSRDDRYSQQLLYYYKNKFISK